MPAVLIPLRPPFREVLATWIDKAAEFRATYLASDYIKAPERSAFAPGIRARRMMRAARRGAA